MSSSQDINQINSAINALIESKDIDTNNKRILLSIINVNNTADKANSIETPKSKDEFPEIKFDGMKDVSVKNMGTLFNT